MACSEGMGKEKRQRSPNFSADEKSLLLTLVMEKRHIVENKKTDGYTNREKEQAWVQITNQFNAQCLAGVRRSTVSLQKLYTNQKKMVRKEAAEDKNYIRRTGGGPSKKKIHNPHFELALATMNKHTVVGFNNEFGGDAENLEDESVDASNDGENRGENESNVVENSTEAPDEEDFNSDSVECSSTGVCSNNVAKAVTNSAPNWGDYKAGHLKTPVANKLDTGNKWKARRRPTLPPVTPSQVNQSYDNLATEKLELVKLELATRRRKDQEETIMFELQKTSMELDIELKKVYLEKLRNAETLSGLPFPTQMK